MLRYAAPHGWNTLPDNIRISEALIVFKRAIYDITVQIFIFLSILLLLFFRTEIPALPSYSQSKFK